ncbi:STAS domain-containing protein [Amycolatopsis aidingensis]|uniref:STAS domain-containing protein n=1 Tax=Amycolatopsis aidingensis TaxID=2842453 RepID=UPI001C0AF1C2|nr:STAS domain-containing protein [Amycolatopsis aidingensis]
MAKESAVTGRAAPGPGSGENDLVCGCLRVRRGQCRGVVVCTVIGEVDLATAPLLDKALAVAPPGLMPRIVDLSCVEFLGLAGARVLLTGSERARGRLSLVAANRPVLRVLDLTGLAGRLAVYRNLAEALDAASDG